MFYLLQETDEDGVFKIIDSGVNFDKLYRKSNDMEEGNRKLLLVEIINIHNPARIKS